MSNRIFAILYLTISQFCYGLDKGPEILRICLDNNTGIATLYWQSSIDNCSSFKKYCIYSSENNGPWKLEDTILSISKTNLGVFLSDMGSDWKFKITTHSACNGIDSFVSNIQSIDQNKPPYLELDSVSFDYSTQKLSAGWKKNPAPDTKGYWIYNYTNSVYDKILDTDKTFILLNTFDKTNPSNISLATFDSCHLFAPINISHKAAYLNANIDTCARSINFNWTKYEGEGWANINQYLILNKNNTGFSKHISLLPNQTSHLISNITLGDNLCYYVRTEEINTKKTSSSNTICFQTRKLIEPKINYLSNVTVDQNTSIKLYFEADNKADTDSILIEREEGSSPFSGFLKFKSDPTKSVYEIEDLKADFNNKYYTYRIKTIDKCGNVSSVSNIGKSILLLNPDLKGNQYEFNWNLYDGWEKGISSQIIETSNNRFTWNMYKTETTDNTILSYPKETLDSDSLCFRIKNTEETNGNNGSSTSVSNIKCIYSITDFYLPTAINPYSNNNILKVYGNGIDKTRGKMEVFNRWGEKIFETKNLEEGWNGKVDDEVVIQGSYLYRAYFYDQQNNSYLKTGSVFIIR